MSSHQSVEATSLGILEFERKSLANGRFSYGDTFCLRPSRAANRVSLQRSGLVQSLAKAPITDR